MNNKDERVFLPSQVSHITRFDLDTGLAWKRNYSLKDCAVAVNEILSPYGMTVSPRRWIDLWAEVMLIRNLLRQAILLETGVRVIGKGETNE